jgi:ATP-dependent helicase HrpB
VRFDHFVGPQTRLIYMTEGIALRCLLTNPMLDRVDALVFDEYHERSLNSDLLLAIARYVQGRRRALRIVVMSATLHIDDLRAKLPGSTVVRVPAKAHPVDIRYAMRVSDEPVEGRVLEAVSTALRESSGDLLAFLATRKQVDDAQRRFNEPGIRAFALHGGLSDEEQQAAFAARDAATRRLRDDYRRELRDRRRG